MQLALNNLPSFTGPLVIGIQAVVLVVLYRRWRRLRDQQRGKVKLKPTGHSAFVEGLIPLAIGIGFFALAFVAAYSFAYDNVQRLLDGTGNTNDVALTSIAGFLGLLNGIATSVAATRWRIHTIRQDPTEDFFRKAAMRMFWLCFGVESLTLNYFLYKLTPESYPGWMGQIIDFVHALMSISRGILIPLDLAFLVAFVADLIISLKDRKRAIQVFTGNRMTLFEQQLTDDEHPLAGDQVEDALNTYAQLQALNEFASDASAAEKAANADLLDKLAGAKGIVPKADLAHLVRAEHLDERLGAMQAAIQAQLDAVVQAATERAGTFNPAELEQRFQDWAERMAQQFSAQFAQAQDRLALMLAEQDDADIAHVALSNSASPPPGALVRTPPKPGTKRFNEWVYTTAQRLLGEDRMTIFNIAQELKVDAQLVQGAIEALKDERIRRLKPGKELTPDPVLDTL